MENTIYKYHLYTAAKNGIEAYKQYDMLFKRWLNLKIEVKMQKRQL